MTLGKRLAASLSAASKCSQTLKPVRPHAATISIGEGIKILIMLFRCNQLHSTSEGKLIEPTDPNAHRELRKRALNKSTLTSCHIKNYTSLALSTKISAEHSPVYWGALVRRFPPARRPLKAFFLRHSSTGLRGDFIRYSS